MGNDIALLRLAVALPFAKPVLPDPEFALHPGSKVFGLQGDTFNGIGVFDVVFNHLFQGLNISGNDTFCLFSRSAMMDPGMCTVNVINS